MHVLTVITQHSFRSNGGVNSAMELLRGLVSAGVSATVVTSVMNEGMTELRALGIRVEVCPSLVVDRRGGAFRRLANVFESCKANLFIRRLIARTSFDVVVTNDRRALWGTVLAARFAGVPIIDFVRDTELKLNLVRRLKWRFSFLLVNRVVVLSRDMVGRWCSDVSVSETRFRPLPSIVDFGRFRPLVGAERDHLRGELGFDRHAKVVLYSAGVRPKKQQLAFLEEAVPTIIGGLPDVRIVFVGDYEPDQDEYAGRCRAVVRDLGLGANVSFMGHRDDVERWYQVSDLVVLASAKEGLARSMIEALSCGVPVVSFDVASAREVLLDQAAGIVVPQGDWDGLVAEALDLLLDDDRRALMSRRAIEHSHERFREAEVIRQYQSILAEVVEEARGV